MKSLRRADGLAARGEKKRPAVVVTAATATAFLQPVRFCQLLMVWISHERSGSLADVGNDRFFAAAAPDRLSDFDHAGHGRRCWGGFWPSIRSTCAASNGNCATNSTKPIGIASRPFLSANDRSRWATVRALVEHGTYAIDDVISDRGWDTIDMVKHVGADGQEHLYSSKPPLLATLMAGPYWLVYHLSGQTSRWAIIPTSSAGQCWCYSACCRYWFIFWCWPPWPICLGTTDWARIFMMAAATGGTFLTTFAVSINNHVIAAACAAVALWALVRILYDGRREARWFALCGLFSALTAANELPALSFLAFVGLVLPIRARARR